jgi:hypothetical protein
MHVIFCSFISLVYATSQLYTSDHLTDKMVKRLKGACAKNKERKAAELVANASKRAVAAIAKTTGDAGESMDPLTADVE